MMKGYNVSLRVQADAVDEDSLAELFDGLFRNKRADFIADWEIDWASTNVTEPNWEEA